MANFKYAFTVVSTNFDLEPVLQQYVDTYPHADLRNYQIAFKTEGEHQAESKSYIIVHEYIPGRSPSPTLYEFLKSYCTVNNLVAVLDPSSHVLPDIAGRHGHILGRYEKK